MSFTPHGKHLIDGNWIATDIRFPNTPVEGPAHTFCQVTPALVNQACEAAETAFPIYAQCNRDSRAAFLEVIADEIEARGAAITAIATRETGLPTARLDGERGRTTSQLRLFAQHIREGSYLDRRHDLAQPDRKPLPRPDLRMMQQAVGPVAVFGASNFPLAFSVAGGDTASALAAGCPVVVKGHPAHPGTSEIVADAIFAAIRRCNMPAGVFALLQDAGLPTTGAALVQHPRIQAVGFTGSLGAGRALFNLCASRPEPIPFFGELGSVNPMFVLPGALAQDAEALGRGWAASLSLGAGQFCTNPGIAVIPSGVDGDRMIAACAEALAAVAPQTMLTPGMADAYERGRQRLEAHPQAHRHCGATAAPRQALPALYEVDAEAFHADDTLAHEIFGPLGLVVRVEDAAATLALARGLTGQLTVTLQMVEADHGQAAALLPVLARKAGRILVNGYPTGVEVVDAMVHGGPYPASTNFGATSVGTLAIRRFLRPVSYQNLPEALLPEDLRSA